MRRPPFRKGLEYVAVKDIRLNNGKQTLKAGEKVPEELRLPTLRRLSRRCRIGPKGHGWTEWMLGKKIPSVEKDPVPQGTGYSQEQWNQLLPEQKAVALSAFPSKQILVEAGNSGWYTITIGGQAQKVQGIDNVTNLLKEEGAPEEQIKELLA